MQIPPQDATDSWPSNGKSHRFGFPTVPGDVDPLALIAAVGKNSGSETDHVYVLGFGLAAEQLFDSFKRGGNEGMSSALYVDALIYPLGFCMRHYLELALKAATRECRELRGKESKLDFRHGLNHLWPAFAEACKEDRRLSEYPARLAPLTQAIDEVDPSGQAFRYRADVKGNVHLGETAVIPIQRAERTFRELRKVLDELFNELEALTWEYSFRTFTDDLSRADLVEIAATIKAAYRPDDKTWMKRLREQVKQQYGLTNTQFDRGDKLISETAFLSWRAGIERPITEITEETISCLYFALAAPPEDDFLSDDEWAGLRGIAEVMRAVGAPEDYPRFVAHALGGSHRFDRVDTARAITRRPDLFVNALRRMGQPTLVAAWIKHWGWGKEQHRR